MRSYRLSKTTVSDTVFQVFLQQTKNCRFLLWLSDQKHGRGTEIALTCLFLRHLNEKCLFWLDQPPGSFRAHTTYKNINKHVWQYYSTSSLIARPVNGLLSCFVVEQTILAVKYWCLWWTTALYMIIFRRRDNLHEARERLNLLLIFTV